MTSRQGAQVRVRAPSPPGLSAAAVCNPILSSRALALQFHGWISFGDPAGVGRTGWHVDGSFQAAPFAYALYHIVSCPTQGDTRGCPVSRGII